MGVKARYAQAMEALYVACIVISGVSLVVITLIIPYGVFMRYVVNSPASWPEPASVLLMIVFSFLGGAAVYRANVHIAVRALLDAVGERTRRWLLRAVDVAMALTCTFMVVYGAQLVQTTWHQVISEFPALSVGLTYLPVPLGGLLTLLFIVERVWVGEPPPTSVMYRDRAEAPE
jgi:TRAP-type C4-dicarboxylate transport system permease small subunit